MRLFTKILFGLITFSAIASCKKENSFPAKTNSPSDEIRSAPPGGNYWLSRQDCPNAVKSANSFVINGKGYVYGGIIFGYRTNDLWVYDPTLNSWTKKASPPFARPRSSAASFAIDGKGYIVGGNVENSGVISSSRDTWEYNPATNTWRQRRNLPEGRQEATGFAINGKGYVAMGRTPSNSYRADILEYDPNLDSWSTKLTLAEELGRISTVSFVIDNKAYIGTGLGDFAYFNDLWEFDPQTNGWIRKADLPLGIRYGAIAFTIGSLGYVGSGDYVFNFPYDNYFWSYNKSSNTWTRKADIPGGEHRANAFGFSIGSYGYVGGGTTESSYYQDPYGFYRYTTSTAGSTQN